MRASEILQEDVTTQVAADDLFEIANLRQPPTAPSSPTNRERLNPGEE